MIRFIPFIPAIFLRSQVSLRRFGLFSIAVGISGFELPSGLLVLGVLNIDLGVARPLGGSFRRTGPERSEKDWARIRSVILDALAGFPGARESVVSALVKLCGMEELKNDDG